ncbi:MAG: N-acetylglucosamine-6-phosphate deacetylase [Ferruginibacter sp.]
MKYQIFCSRLFTGDKIIDDAFIIVENAVITSLGKNITGEVELTDLKSWNLAPGFLDIQVNGGEKFYFSQSPTEETLHDICDSSLQYGTTHTLPCLISSTQEHILRAIETVKEFMQKHDKGVLGMHLEGPFINPVKRGAHVKKMIRKPTDTELEEIIRYGKDVIKVLTIAPECFTVKQLEMLMESGFVLSAGHTDMNYEQAQFYFSNGISLVTHLYNAMNQLQHRAPGLVGAVLDNDKVYAPVILDGAHCDYAAARIAYKIKQDKLFLISDAAFLGRKLEHFKWGEFNANLVEGFYRNKEGNLAGAAISMVEAVRNAILHLNISLENAMRMATSIPAKAIQMEHKVGYIRPGYPARFIKFNDSLTQYESLIY